MIALLAALLVQDDAIDDAARLHLVGRPDPGVVRETLEESGGVADVAFDDGDGSVTFRYKGKIAGLEAIEKKLTEKLEGIAKKGDPKKAVAAGAYLVSHVRMRFSLTAGSGSGADMDKLKRTLGEHRGVKKVLSISHSSLEMICDATQLWPPDLVAMAATCGFGGSARSHELIEVRVAGDKWDALTRELNAVRNVLMVRVDPTGRLARILGRKGDVKDADLRASVEKAGMTLEQVRRP